MLSARLPRVFVLLYAVVVCSTLAFGLLRGEDPKPVPQSAESKLKERRALDQTYRSLEEELKAAIPEYSKAIAELQKAGLPREQWPKSPANDFYPRFEALAVQDQPDSLRWCLGVITSIDLSIDMRISKKDALYKRYVASSIDSAFTDAVIGFLFLEGGPEGIGIERAVGFLDQIAKGASKSALRAQAAWTKAQLYQKGAKPEHKELALAAMKELIAAYPKSTEAIQAKGILFVLERLQVGMTAPDVETLDVDGKAFKLSDSRGKATLIVFFGFWHRATPQLLTQLKALETSLKDKPFTIVGVAAEDKPDDFKKSIADSGLDWKISWQGGRAGPWIAEWGVSRMPSIYLLDESGVIRAVNVELPDIKQRLAEIFARMEAPKKDAK